ncbi:helix-turn-helix transcriptional regulator [Thermomicrobiaceae bacterium CFH 74404]|uniref:Helix-turn-helix transcriptional regulator n=1 Tax=Thermalbibacter longus TaxID=2951981 RepID=A0AA42BBH8_9BACT|nr:helix-turn-helix domain-containing protein [Thermalbibacter longus]MCM8749775.1 helix-turn-helix transcriptional regulator [Thermalbibacter longus]
MPGYHQFCPVSKGAEIFAERWTPLILRELLCGSHRFSELLRGIPRISPNLLIQRLRSLERDGVIERRPARNGHGWEYYLTPAGEELGPVVELLGGWGYRWALGHLSEEDCDPETLMWFVHRQIKIDQLPDRRVVVRFEFSDDPKGRRFWLILDRPQVDLCLRDEGFEVDLEVQTDIVTFNRVYLGHLDLRDAIRRRLVLVEGDSSLARDFPDWIGTSPFVRFGSPETHPGLHARGIRWPALRHEPGSGTGAMPGTP